MLFGLPEVGFWEKESGTASSIATVHVARSGVPSLPNMVNFTATLLTIAVSCMLLPQPNTTQGGLGFLACMELSIGWQHE